MSNDVIIKIISNIFQIYNLLIFVRIMTSWFSVDRDSQLYILLHMITEPVLRPFRNLFNSFGLLGSGIDFSPIAAIFVLNYIRNFIIRILL